MPRRALALTLPALALIAACGARGPLDAGSGSFSASTSTTSGAGGGTTTVTTGIGGGSTSTSGAGGAGGAPGLCSTLVWAGEPVFVSAEDHIESVRLLRTGIGEHALVFDTSVPDATLLESMALPAWWTSWPPPMGKPGITDASSWQSGLHAVSTGEPGSFAFATMNGGMKIGQAAPGQASNALAGWPGPSGEAKALARNNGGAYLAGYGILGLLAIDVMPAYVPNPKPVTQGPLGCASMKLAADAVGLGDDAFLVANTNDAPFDDCADPVLPGPPTVVQIVKVASTGAVTKGAFIQESGPVLDLQIAGRIGGGWLAYRVAGNPTLHIRPVDENGQLGDDTGDFGSPLYGDAIAALDSGFVHAFTFPGAPDAQAPPFVNVYVRHGSDEIQLQQAFGTPVHPAGRPAVAVSDDGRSILVAFIEDPQDGTAPSIGLARADCAP